MSVNDSNRLYMTNEIFNKMSKDILSLTPDGSVKKIQKENLTPYKIVTVILIKDYCNETAKGIVYCLCFHYMIENCIFYKYYKKKQCSEPSWVTVLVNIIFLNVQALFFTSLFYEFICSLFSALFNGLFSVYNY